MVGYGPEETHFVVELTYNYNISNYKLGNDFQGITIQSRETLARAKQVGWLSRRKLGVLSWKLLEATSSMLLISLHL
jgi:hypothetical protein